MFAHSLFAQFLAAGLNSNAPVRRLEAKSASDAVFQNRHVRVLKLNDMAAINANQVIVVRMIVKIWIIKG